jgi:hypothetical protein
MNPHEIECLINQAVSSCPKVTIAPMNLYLHQGTLICGARIVMPADSVFVAHVAPDQLQNGFDEKQWKLLIEKVGQLTGDNCKAIAKQPQKMIAPLTNYDERRKEPRLYYRRPLWFTHNYNNKELAQGVMCDVSSGGLSFTCCCENEKPVPGGQIVTRFEVPRCSDGLTSQLKFDRASRICGVSQVDNHLHRIAVQFANPLLFKPAQQTAGEYNTQVNLQNSAV